MGGAIAAVENNFHLYPAPIGVHKRFGDGRGGKAIGLDYYYYVKYILTFRTE
jgi:hypothetical protein